MEWIKLSDREPGQGQRVLISDGHEVSAAITDLTLRSPRGGPWWDGCGFGGYEWDWDFDPTHWAPMPSLPTPED